MIQSESIGALASALVIAQAEFEVVAKEADNPFFKSKYADLPAVVKAASPILGANGLAVVQTLGDDTLTTILLHKSGEYIGDTSTMHLVKSDPQGVGSAVTYHRRYGYMAILGLVADVDDDGNAASKPVANTTTVHREAPVRPAATSQARTALNTAPDPSKISQKQLGMVQGLFKDKGFPEDRDVRHAYAALIVGHEFSSTKDLSKQDASKLITALQAEPIPGDEASQAPFSEPEEEEEVF